MITYLQIFDRKILNLLSKKIRCKVLDKIMPLITALGNGAIVWTIISLYLIKNENYRIEGYMVITSIILVTIIGEGIIKHIIKRTRPFEHMKINKLLISKPITYSFPSGHTASSFAASGILIMMDNKLSIIAVILASLIAFSRIYLNVHYPLDVITGIVLGLICSKVVVIIFNSESINYLYLTEFSRLFNMMKYK